MKALAAAGVEQPAVLRQRILMGLVFLAAVVAAATVSAQRPPKKEDPKLKPRPEMLRTKDGVDLAGFYFPSDKGKEAIPVLLIHEWKGQKSPYGPLAMALKEAGCAVFAFDYRGHGGSKEYKSPRGGNETFNVDQMSRRDVEAIIALDMEKAKAFLKDENNAGNLNLNALVVIGVREGCVMAAHWSQRDWRFPSVGRLKQGQDVKAMVFVSPEKLVKGVAIDQALNDSNLMMLPMMVVAGADSPEAAEANRLSKRIESVKKRIGKGETSGFETKMLDTTLSGPALVNEVSDVIPSIVKFVTSEVSVSGDVNPWVYRD